MVNGQKKNQEPKGGRHPVLGLVCKGDTVKKGMWVGDNRHPVFPGVLQGGSHPLYCQHHLLYRFHCHIFWTHKIFTSLLKFALKTIISHLSGFHPYSITLILLQDIHKCWTTEKCLCYNSGLSWHARRKNFSSFMNIALAAPCLTAHPFSLSTRMCCSQNGWRPPSFGSRSIPPLSSCQLVSLSSL